MTNVVRYATDPTGSNPDNLVSGEVVVLSNRPIRAFAPKYGPFYVNSLIVYDKATGATVPSSGYKVPMICQEPTLRYGEAIADAVIVTDQSVSSEIYVTYQALGGTYQNNVDNIVQIFESWANDNRNIDYDTGVFNKPLEFPPSQHAHFLSDIFGFEPIVFELERIVQALMVGNNIGYEQIIQALLANTLTEADIDSGNVSAKVVTYDMFVYALRRLGATLFTVKPESNTIFNGRSCWVSVKSTQDDENDILYWTIEHITTTPDDFVVGSGLVQMTDGDGRFMVQVRLDTQPEEEEHFRVVLRKGSQSGVVLAKSKTMTLPKHASHRNDRIIDGMRFMNISSPRIRRTVRTIAGNRAAWTGQLS